MTGLAELNTEMRSQFGYARIASGATSPQAHGGGTVVTLDMHRMAYVVTPNVVILAGLNGGNVAAPGTV